MIFVKNEHDGKIVILTENVISSETLIVVHLTIISKSFGTHNNIFKYVNAIISKYFGIKFIYLKIFIFYYLLC